MPSRGCCACDAYKIGAVDDELQEYENGKPMPSRRGCISFHSVTHTKALSSSSFWPMCLPWNWSSADRRNAALAGTDRSNVGAWLHALSLQNFLTVRGLRRETPRNTAHWLTIRRRIVLHHHADLRRVLAAFTQSSPPGRYGQQNE